MSFKSISKESIKDINSENKRKSLFFSSLSNWEAKFMKKNSKKKNSVVNKIPVEEIKNSLNTQENASILFSRQFENPQNSEEKICLSSESLSLPSSQKKEEEEEKEEKKIKINEINDSHFTTNLLIIPLVKKFISKLKDSCSLRNLDKVSFKIVNLLDENPNFFNNENKVLFYKKLF